MSQPQFPQQAYQTLVGRVHAPVFFEKLARDWGVVPQTEEDQGELLELASVLRTAQQQNTQKTAGAGSSFIKEAADSLKGALTDSGLHSNVPTSRERMIKEAAAEVIADPDVARAALEYGHYLGQLEEAQG